MLHIAISWASLNKTLLSLLVSHLCPFYKMLTRWPDTTMERLLARRWKNRSLNTETKLASESFATTVDEIPAWKGPPSKAYP